MERDQILSLLNTYEGGLKVLGATPIRFDKEAKMNTNKKGRRKDVLNHICYMVGEIRIFIENNKMEKANRWLGFVQACIWNLGYATLGELRTDNR